MRRSSGTRSSSDRLFANTNLSYNNMHFPLYQKTGLQSIDGPASTGSSTRNAHDNTAIMFRRRLQFTSNWQYFVPEMLGGRHEFKVGFDNGYTPEDVDTDRVDNVNLTRRTRACGDQLPAPRR